MHSSLNMLKNIEMFQGQHESPLLSIPSSTHLLNYSHNCFFSEHLHIRCKYIMHSGHLCSLPFSLSIAVPHSRCL